MGVDFVVKGALVDDFVALQFLDGDKEFLTGGGIIVIVITEHLGSPFLTDDISVLVDECALVGVVLGNFEFSEMTVLVEGVLLAAAVVALDGYAPSFTVKEGCKIDGLALALALLEIEAMLGIIGIGVVHHGLVALAALDGGLRQQTLLVEDEHVVALGAVRHDDMFIHTARAAVEAHVKMLDAVTVCRVVHQVAVEQFHSGVDCAHGVHVCRQALERHVLGAVFTGVLGMNQP